MYLMCKCGRVEDLFNFLAADDFQYCRMGGGLHVCACVGLGLLAVIVVFQVYFHFGKICI